MSGDPSTLVINGYGMVMTNTLPLTLTGTLPDLASTSSANADAATGLVHQGGGRWYPSTTLRAGYPALGRPLQPHAAGGPPTLPQALNRYSHQMHRIPDVPLGQKN